MTMILPRLSRSTALAPPSHLLATTFLLLLALSHTVYGAPEKKAKPLDPCTVRSPTNHAFFDLNPIARHPPTEKDIERHKNDPEPYGAHSYHARGYDYGANFTLNFCAPVVEGVKDVEGVEERLWKNVTGYYEKGGRTYSIGTLNGEPFFRGRKLVLNYTEGSPCPGSSPSFLDRRSTTNRRGRRDLLSHEAEDLEKSEASKARPFWDDDGEDDDDDWRHRNNSSTSHDGVRRKSTILSLHCEKDPLAPKAHLSYVGSMDECTYFFEVRTLAACAGVETAKESVSPGGVFGVM